MRSSNIAISMSLDCHISQKYIELVGSNFTDRFGKCENDEAEKFVETIEEVAFQKNAYDELDSGWRNVVEIHTEEYVAGKFVKCCSNMFLNDSLSLEDTIKLIQPLLIEAGKEYKTEHIEALKNAPIEYRKKQAEYLSPLIKVCSNEMSLDEILSLLIDGVFDNTNPLGRDNKSRSVAETLQARIEQKSDSIDLEDDYFYQGPRHLGVLPTGKDKQIARCVCKKTPSGHIIPIFLSEDDPVNREARELLDYIDWTN